MSRSSKSQRENGFRAIWSVSDFAREYRLSKLEESRLRMLHGSFAGIEALMESGKKAGFIW